MATMRASSPRFSKRRRDGHGADDVGDDQQFEAEQDGAPEIGAQALVGRVESAAEAPTEDGERERGARQQRKHADDLHPVGGTHDPVFVVQHHVPPSDCRRLRSSRAPAWRPARLGP